MKILICNAVWGEAYCSIFTRFSLASLLSPNNIPLLSKQATITYHIVTTFRDRQRLLRDRAVAQLKRYCTVEWEILEDYGISQPPAGAGGEKYPFLSALQNLAITRSLDHDAVIFNYADFIWADGSVTVAVEMLCGERPVDAVLAFCPPVDRDAAMPDLAKYRDPSNPSSITLSPRNAAKIAVEHLHREAKLRFWDGPSFTNLPTYLIWKVTAGQGLLLRAYHQSILAIRVLRDEPKYSAGIERGGLDDSFTAQLAKTGSVVCASDTEKILVFSLYDTPVDSRLPPGQTREMSLASVLRADVTPEQRVFAEHPIFLKLRDGDTELWQSVIEESGKLLRQAQEMIPFDKAEHEARYTTQRVIPRLSRKGFFRSSTAVVLAGVYLFGGKFGKYYRKFGEYYRKSPVALPKELRLFVRVLRQPSQLRHSRRLERFLTVGNRRKYFNFILRYLRWLHIPPRPARAIETFTRHGFEIVPNLWIADEVTALLGKAIDVENSANSAMDDADFMSRLRAAEEMLVKATTLAPLWVVPRRAIGRNLWFQGRFEEAMQHFAAAEQLRDAMAWAANWPVDSCVYLPRNCAEIIGLMGHLDSFVKHKLLTADSRPYYLIAPNENVINPAFFSYWADHIVIISDRAEIDKHALLERAYSVDWNWAMPQGGKVVFSHQGMAATQRAWSAAGRSPLLRLRQEHADALSRVRVKWGMAADQRFVCLHVRSPGFYDDAGEQSQRFRNTSTEDYYPLIRALREMGLWVIRMGDSSMPPLDLAQCDPSQGGVIDYAQSGEKSAELDVALCAQCELFVSSPSGLHTVAHAFGSPVCEVNYPIYKGFPWHSEDIFIPQLYYSRRKERVLTLREIMGSDIVHRDQHFLLERAGISLIPNGPEDIIETVREALSPLTYQLKDSAVVDKVFAEFDDLNRLYNLRISGRLGRYFAMKYAAKLLPEQDH